MYEFFYLCFFDPEFTFFSETINLTFLLSLFQQNGELRRNFNSIDLTEVEFFDDINVEQVEQTARNPHGRILDVSIQQYSKEKRKY